MATYKVIQDVEAEDKLVGPLTLRQFIYAAIAAVAGWLAFIAITKGAAFMLVLLLPIMLLAGFLAAPWGGDQPTEIWAVAKLRFFLKPRRRIWDQSGTKELVTITVPKHIERQLTNGLNQTEVRSRLNALANTIDSRGWAVKNVNVNVATMQAQVQEPSDRLVEGSTLPISSNTTDVTPADDMMDEQANPVAHNLDSMMSKSADQHRQALLQQMKQAPAQTPPADQTPLTTTQTPQTETPPTSPQANYWFMQQQPAAPIPGQATFANTSVVAPGATEATQQGLPQAATPTAEEEAFVAQHAQDASDNITNTYSHLKTIKTPEQLAEEQKRAAQQAPPAPSSKAKAQVTSEEQAAIMNLASNDDLDIATLARQAHKDEGKDGEVVISLH